MSVTDYLSDVVRPAGADSDDPAGERRARNKDKWSGDADRARDRWGEASGSLESFIGEYRSRLNRLLDSRLDADRQAHRRGLPPFALREVRGVSTSLASGTIPDDPLAAYIPTEYGGRGARMVEGLAVLDATGYESLPLCLMVGINGALFLHPVAKYGDESVKTEVFQRFLDGKSMGGLMITEPDHGTDALRMQTSSEPTGNGTVRIKGTKHWAGLTGWADYWLLTARARKADGSLGRTMEFYICDVTQPGQHIHVEETFPNLGLYMIPYGRNRIDVEVPARHQLHPETTGTKMLLDLLHRSRLQFPGMAMGFLRRMRDEAVRHTETRMVGGKTLMEYDQVQARLARLQASATTCAAMCAYTAETGGIDNDCSGMSIEANAFKTTATDMMHEAAQSLLQLVGAQGYRQDHLAGRSLTDTRPFQIFEGSNDVLYGQVAAAIMKRMRRVRETRLGSYLAEAEPLTAQAGEILRGLFDFDVDRSMPQRKVVELGKALSRALAIEMVIGLGGRGYPAELITQALDSLRAEVRMLVCGFRASDVPRLVTETATAPSWLEYVHR